MSLLGTLREFSLHYLVLRVTTSSGAVIAGLIQTFVFVRVLSADLFSIFIVVGSLGMSLWLFDLGIAKILFVRIRACHLQSGSHREMAGEAAAVVWLYTALVAAGGLICFAAMAAWPNVGSIRAAEFSLFFVFAALNLVWFALRNISIAVDEFVSFESLEATRRVGHIAIMLAMLSGLSVLAFVLLANALWAVLIALAVRRLLRKDAITVELRGRLKSLRDFFRTNRTELMRSGAFAASELYIYNFPYVVVPLAIGLGAPTIILDTTFKIFRGAALIYAVGCDIAVPGQTRAYAEGDAPTLLRVTITALSLSALPTALLCIVLFFGADPIFNFLLAGAVTMPRAVEPILVVLLSANLVQNFATSLMIHTGFFRDMSHIAIAVALALTAVSAIVVFADLDIVGFLIAYMCVYVGGALAFVSLALRGPIQSAGDRAAPV